MVYRYTGANTGKNQAKPATLSLPSPSLSYRAKIFSITGKPPCSGTAEPFNPFICNSMKLAAAKSLRTRYLEPEWSRLRLIAIETRTYAFETFKQLKR